MSTNVFQYGRLWVAPLHGKDDTPPSSGDPQNPPKQDGTDYKTLYEQTKTQLDKAQADATKSYTGLQQTLSREQAAKKTLEESLQALNGQFQEVTGIRTTLDTELQTVKSTLSTKDEELKSLRLAKIRTGLIMKEFPALAAFEADGLIPQPADAVDAEGKVDEAKLRSIFTSFQTHLLSVADVKKQQYNQGGTPQNPPSSENATAQGFLALANKAAKEGDMKTYNENFSKYLEAQAKVQ